MGVAAHFLHIFTSNCADKSDDISRPTLLYCCGSSGLAATLGSSNRAKSHSPTSAHTRNSAAFPQRPFGALSISVSLMTKTSLKPRRVLIADDNEKVLSLLVELLEQEGYEVLRAQDGGTALELALANELDAVVSDVVMPVLDGIELCKRLKRHVETARVPVLLISGVRRTSDDGLEGLTAGADDYLDVPFRNEAFLVKVARLAERHQIEKHYREIVEQAADIIYTRTIDGHITSINAAGCEFFGRSANELVGVSSQ